MSRVRLDKLLADAGLGARSQVKLLIKKGLVTVNGQPAAGPEQKVDAEELFTLTLMETEGNAMFSIAISATTVLRMVWAIAFLFMARVPLRNLVLCF